MFLKASLTFLAIGALSVNALTTLVVRSPAPEPESQELEARSHPGLAAYDLFSRELQALDELFSREPKDWAEWAGSARDYHTAKREASPGNARVSTLYPANTPQGQTTDTQSARGSARQYS